MTSTAFAACTFFFINSQFQQTCQFGDNYSISEGILHIGPSIHLVYGQGGMVREGGGREGGVIAFQVHHPRKSTQKSILICKCTYHPESYVLVDLCVSVIN